MITRISLIILTLIFSSIPASAEIKLILSSRYEIKNTGARVLLGDIAKIEGSTDACQKLNDLIIEPDIYIDGYIDRNEIIELVKSNIDDIFIIYGNAVRIVKNNDAISADIRIINDIKDADYLVKKGDAANLILVRRGISIELYGKAMNDGKLGDIISVELKLMNSSRTKLVKGKVSARNQIEVDL